MGEKVYGRRKDLSLSQEELAQRVGTTQRLISQIENGSYASKQGIGEDYYDRLAKALEIDRDYLFSEKINRKTFELFIYLEKKLRGELDIMQYMKLPYFIDLTSMKTSGCKLTNFEYYRCHYGPFDPRVYAYQSITKNFNQDIKYSYLESMIEMIDSVLENLPCENGTKLKKLSYETPPMKALGATLSGKEFMGKELDLSLA